MRIGIDCRTYGPNHGYIGKYLQSFIDHIDKNEDTNEYVLFFSERDFGEFVPSSPRIRTVKTRAESGSAMEQLSFPLELRKAKLDLMFFSGPIMPLAYTGKTVSMVPDLVSYFYPEKHQKGSGMRFLHNFLLRQSMRKSSRIIVWSEVLKRDIIEIFDTPEEKIEVIAPMCLATKLTGKDDGKAFLNQEKISEKYLLSVGELREYKNIPRLLQTYPLLIKESGMDMDLVLVGKEDPSYHDIRSNLIQLGLQGRVHIYNILEDDKIDILYKNASAYILPSLYEGSEQSVLSALDYGLPIISSLLPSIVNVLGKDGAAFFRPMSAADMKDALGGPLPKPKKQNTAKYSIDTISNKIVDIFNACNVKKE